MSGWQERFLASLPMNIALFNAQLNTAWDLLNDLSIGSERNWSPDYAGLGASAFRHLSYLDVWKKCVNETFYDFQLSDNSLLQFRVPSYSPLELSYVYYECPYECLAYEEFVQELGFAYEDVHDELKPEYGDYVTTCDAKDTVTPIRYDLSPALYRAGGHPASHIHFGHNSDIRVGTRRILRPLSFVLFVLRQCYSKTWQRLLARSDAEILCRNVKQNLTDVPREYWDVLDEREMTLI
jgi:hypothetical protein